MRFFLPLLIIATAAFGQQDFSKVEIKVHHVAGSVYMLEGAGGNIGVSVGDDGILIVDDQYAPLAPKIRAALAGISDKPVKFVLNTHYHGDHTGGNEQFGETAPIIAHTNVRKRLASGVPARNIEPAAKGALPVITFDDRLVVHVNGEDIRAIHTPSSHTDGDSIIFFTRSDVVHMGDNFFNGRFPFIDLDGGGSVLGYIKAVARVLNEVRPGTKIIPGHGPLGTPADLKAYLNMLKEASGIVSDAIREGKSLEQLKQANPLAKYSALSWQFITTDRFLETLYRDLSRNK